MTFPRKLDWALAGLALGASILVFAGLETLAERARLGELPRLHNTEVRP